MDARTTSLWIARGSALGLLVLALCGCGSRNSTAPERPSGAIEGTVFAAPVSGATVRAYAFHDGRRGELLGEAQTDASGRFAVAIKTQDGPVLLETSGGVYREEASGREITLPVQPVFRSLVRYANSGPAPRSSITTFTTLATGLAEHLVSRGQGAQAAMDQAFASLDAALGLDVRAVTPLDITDTANATGGLTPGHEYGFFQAAVSQWTAEAGARNGTAAHTTYTSASFTALGYDDIRTDGVLDGRAGDTPLSVGTIPLSTDTYRLELALALLRAARSAANRTSLGAERLLPAANRWNESTVAMFGNAQVTPLSSLGPLLSNLQPAADARVRGVVGVRVAADDPIGLAEVAFAFDGQPVGTAAGLANPGIEIDTRAHPDGPHELRAQARNLAGGTAALAHTVVVDNTAPAITNFQPASGSVPRRFRASANVSDAMLGDSVFLLARRLPGGGYEEAVALPNLGTTARPESDVNTGSGTAEFRLTLRATDAAGNLNMSAVDLSCTTLIISFCAVAAAP